MLEVSDLERSDIPASRLVTVVCVDSQEKIRALKKNLQSCKTLLRCKREELKRLWLEDVRFKHMLKLIDTM